MRHAIAKWLCPEMARDAERYRYLIGCTSEAWRWLGDHPDASDTAQWLIERNKDHWRKLSEPPTGTLPHQIHDLREHLSRRAASEV